MIILLLALNFAINGYAATIITPGAETSWRSIAIDVCFEPRTQDIIEPTQAWTLEFYKMQIALQLKQEIARAGVHLTSWHNCTTNDTQSIRLNLTLHENYAAHVQFLGKRIAGVENGVNLNYPTTESPEWYPLTTALHEVMHALGFHHEHERPDASSCNDQASMNKEVIDLAYLLGEYDPLSIMNYCLYDQHRPPSTMEEGLALDLILAHLTDADIRALRTIFFEPLVRLVGNARKIPRPNEQIGLEGFDANSYSYKWIWSDQEKCTNIDSYSDFIEINKPITLNNRKRPLALCLRGRNFQQTQSLDMATIYVWPKKQGRILSQSLEILHHSQPIQLSVPNGVKYKISPKARNCNALEDYKLVLSSEINTRVSDWLPPSSSEGYFCLIGESRDKEHFVIVPDGIAFEIINQSDEILDVKPALMGGFSILSYKYAQVFEGDHCPHSIQDYSKAIRATKTLKLSIKQGTQLCSIAQYIDGSWSPLSNPRITNLTEID
jgi:hypothetical protein